MVDTLKKAFQGLLVFSFLGLAACSGEPAKTGSGAGSPEDAGAPAQTGAKEKIVIGTTAGDFGDMVKDKIGPLLEAKGYKVELVEFSDYVRPNLALAEGSLDVNVFQHKPYLDDFAKTHNLDLTPLFTVPTAPLGIYSGKLDSLDKVTEGSTVSVSNDPSNLARALVMLDTLGWIKVKDDVDPLTVSVNDIVGNPHGIKLVELEAAQVPRSRSDVDFAMINGNYAASSHIPLSEGLYLEPGYTYVNVGVVKTADKDAPWVKDVIEAYKSPEFREYSYKRFPGYKYPQDWPDAPKAAVAEAAKYAKAAADEAVTEAKEAVEEARDDAEAAARNAVEKAKELAEDAKNAAGEAVDKVKDAANDLKDSAGAALEGAKDSASEAVDNAKDAVNDAKDAASDAVVNAKDSASEAVDNAKEAASDAKEAAAYAVNDAKDSASEAAKDAKEAAGNAVDKVKEAVTEIVGD